MIINAYASQRHYLNKLIPIWNALPDELKGDFSVHARLDGMNGLKATAKPEQNGILMVASHHDAKWATGKFIYVEHGAGQSYDPTMWYSNITRPNMLAALVPGPYCAQKTMAANPDVAVIPIGAPHLGNLPVAEELEIVFAWHWRCSVAIEANTAFDEYALAVVETASRWKTSGHGHPRIFGELIPFYNEYGIDIIERPEDALSKAAILIADNTSLIYEAACLDIPVILLNGSSWRRNKHWGLRFWDFLPGPMIDSPDDLSAEIERQIKGDCLNWASMRQQVSNQIYGPNPLTRLDSAIDQIVEVVKQHARFN